MGELSAESIPVFQEGISLFLSTWDALDAAVSNGFGSPAGVRDLGSHFLISSINPIAKHFPLVLLNVLASVILMLPVYSDPIYADNLEELLEDGLDSFGIDAEDGSIEKVAADLIAFHGECLERQYQRIQNLRERKQKLSFVVRQVVNASDDDDDDNEDDDDNMMVDAPVSLPVVIPSLVQKNGSGRGAQQMGADEDGWVTVSSRKNKG